MAAARFGMAYLLETGHYFAILSGEGGAAGQKMRGDTSLFFVKNI